MWLMLSPENKKQIYAKLPEQRLGRMGILNILSEKVQAVFYGVTCMQLMSVVLQLPRVL